MTAPGLVSRIPPPRAADWSDTHHGRVAPEIITARQAFETAFDRLPKAMDWALHLRDFVVKPFGLTTVSDGTLTLASLPVLREAPDVYEVGLEDKHLTFTLETALTAQVITVTTRIWYNNWSGRVYLAAVMVPHKWIIRYAIRSIAT